MKERIKTEAPENTPRDKRNKLLWSALFIAIAAATVWAVVSQSKTFSFNSFLSYINGSAKMWLIAAFISMLGFIVFEGEAILAACRAFGYPVSHRRGFAYSASDIYFSAITPSATGGQPACAYFMIKDGIPGTVTTVALLLNLIMYTASILVMFIIAVTLSPKMLVSLGGLSRVLIAFGCIVQTLLTILLVMLLFKGNFLRRICRSVLHFLAKIKLIKKEDEKKEKLDKYMDDYAEYAKMIKNHKKAMVKVFIFNLLQRACVISVPLFVFLASGGAVSRVGDIWAVQCYSIMGSNSIPIPGAMGVSDYIMLDGFGKILTDAVNFELLSRSLSFYFCVVLCGITVLFKYWILRKRGKKL